MGGFMYLSGPGIWLRPTADGSTFLTVEQDEERRIWGEFSMSSGVELILILCLPLYDLPRVIFGSYSAIMAGLVLKIDNLELLQTTLETGVEMDMC